MTPREILEKYGLKTDVKSIRERMEGNLCLYLGIVDHFYPMLSHNTRERKADEIYAADLDLLCEMAEKVEKIAVVCDNWFHAIDALHRIEEILEGEKE